VTLSELNKHFELKSRLDTANEMLERMRSAAGLQAQNMTGMPRSDGEKNKIELITIKISSMERRVNDLKTAVALSQDKIERWIETIPSADTGMIFWWRFVMALSWGEVADAMGRNYTEASVKSVCYSYLKTPEPESSYG